MLKLYLKVLVSRKNSQTRNKRVPQRCIRKSKDFLESYENPTKSATHDKNSDEKYERNIQNLKIIIRAVLLCEEQRIALTGYREQVYSNDAGKDSDSEKTMQRGNCLAIINAFATLDAALIEHLEKCVKNAKMVSWKIPLGRH